MYIAQLITAIGGLPDRPHSLHLRVGTCSFLIRCSDPSTRQVLADYLAAFITPSAVEGAITIDVIDQDPVTLPISLTNKEPELGKTKLKEAYADLADGRVVRKTRTGMLFIFGKQTNIAIGPCHSLPNQVVNFINNRQIEQALDDEWQLLHAAGVCGRNAELGMALSGFAGKGKSTLALALLDRGLRYVSNDRLLVRRASQGLRMHGVAKYPRINPGTALADPKLASLVDEDKASHYRSMTTTELWEVEDKHDVPVERIYGDDTVCLSHALSDLIIITWSHQPAPPALTRIELAHRPDLFPAFTKDPGLFYLPADRHSPGIDHEAYLNVLADCRVWELNGGIDIAAGAKLLAELNDTL